MRRKLLALLRVRAGVGAVGFAALGFVGVFACGGERLHLGDGPLEASANNARDAGDVAETSSLGETPDASAAPCALADVAADEVVWIGDSWLTIPGTQRSLVEAYARAAGWLGPTEQYVSLAEPASSLEVVLEQFRARQSSAVLPQVVIMDGGTWDTILSGGSAESVVQVLSSFEAFLREVAEQSRVKHLVYLLMPELPNIPGVAALRPGLRAACEQSEVPCQFVDLEPLWAGHPEYTDSSGFQASESGATVIADTIWSALGAACAIRPG